MGMTNNNILYWKHIVLLLAHPSLMGCKQPTANLS